MTTKIKFTKMHGAGNDYIYVDTTRYPIADPEKKAIEWSKFHTGIGSDGLILIGSSDKADFSMRIFNADGSEAMMCGNGSRCVGKYVYEYGLTAKKKITLDTRSGIKVLKLHVEGINGKPASGNFCRRYYPNQSAGNWSAVRKLSSLSGQDKCRVCSDRR